MSRTGSLLAVLLASFACLLWAPVAWADATFYDMEGRLEVVQHPDGSAEVSLRAGGPLGLGGLAGGRVDTGVTEEAVWLTGEEEVSGIEPTPFFPVGEGDYSGISPTPFAPDGERVLTFSFDTAGDFSGISPQPFHVYLFTPSGLVGELFFEDATAEMGSLVLSGVVLDEGGGVSEIPTFTITAVPEAVPLAAGPGVVALVAGLGATGCVALRVRRPEFGARRSSRRAPR